MRNIKMLLATAAPVALLLSAGSASAQSDAASAAVEEVVVTGTSLRGIKPAGSATVAVGVEDLKSAGIANPIDLQRVVPQLLTSNFIETSANSNSNSTKGQTFNLRGLGAVGTLVLVDGRRVVPNGTSTPYVDANLLPLVAVARVEVVTDGASAIYGADAVGGVVNFITQKNMDGAQLSARWTRQLGQDQVEFTAGLGRRWEIGGREGSFYGALAWQNRESMQNTASPFLSQNLTRFGGNDNRVNGTTVQSNAPGTLAVASTTPGQFLYYALPANKNTGLTFADLTPGLGNIARDADNIDYLGQELRTRAMLTGQQELNDWLTGNFTAIYHRRTTDTLGSNLASSYKSIQVTPSSRFYIPGIPNSRGNQFVNQQFDPFNQRTHEESYNVTAGLEARLPRDFRGIFYATYGSNRACGNCLQEEVISQAVNTYVARGVVNPYGPFPSSVQDLFRGPRFDKGTNNLFDVVAKVDGKIFSLPMGDVVGAVGVEFQKQEFTYGGSSSNTPDASFLPARPATAGDRKVMAYFAEVNVPLVTPEMNLGFIRNVNVNLADRFEDYSDVGTANSPKVGATAELAGGLAFRANWGKSFRAPALQETNAGTLGNSLFQSINNAAGDPKIPITDVATGRSVVLSLLGGNDQLEPEKATTFSVGVDYQPEFVRGLSFGVTYYGIDYTDRIAIQPNGSFLANPANRAQYAPYIFTVAPQPSTCVNGDITTYSAEVRAYAALSPYRDAGQAEGCQVVAVVDGRSQNLSKVEQRGVDLQATYRVDTDNAGSWTADLRMTKILSNREALRDDTPFIDRLDVIGFPVDLKGRLSLTWDYKLLTTTLGVNYVDSYLNNNPITVAGVLRPNSTVPSWTTFDLNFGLQVPEFSPWLTNSRLSLALLNVTDKDPPVVLTGNNAFDSRNHSVFGRVMQIELTKRF